jgi:DNA-binding transcriptional LysR family regulator
MAIRLDDLDYFLAVATHGKVRRAAAALGVSQAAVTQGLQRLEKELGFPLFVRSVSGMELTRVAEQFRKRTRTLRTGLDEAIKEAADRHLGEMGVLRVGVSPLYVQRLFAPAALELQRQRPASRLSVMLNLNDVLITALRVSDIDLAIAALPDVMPEDLQSLPLIEDDLILVVREDHPLLRRRRLRLQDLADAQWLLPGPGVAARRTIEGRFAKAGLPPPRVAIEVNNTGVDHQLNQIVVHSNLISVMGESMIGTSTGKGLSPLPMVEARLARTVGALTRQGAPLPPLADRFLELLQSAKPIRTASARIRS